MKSMSTSVPRNRLVSLLRRGSFVIKSIRCMASEAARGTTAAQKTLDTSVRLPSLFLDGWPSVAYQKFAWLGKYGPCFPVRGEQVLVLTEPTEFYEVLKVKTKKAKKRITFASLYLGTGSLEKDLVSCLHEACTNAAERNKTDFKVNVLLDMTRGSRGEVNSRTMLLGLMKEFPEQVGVSLYHTPDLRGMLRAVMPERYNEIIGLTHIKVYLMDDSVIISGANLSNDYFTNRQDRYVLFNDCKDMADFFDELVKTVSSFSFQLHKDDQLHLDKKWEAHPFQGSKAQFKVAAGEKVESLLKCQIEMQKGVYRQLYLQPHLPDGQKTEDLMDESGQTFDTWVYPLVQMGPFGIHRDEEATLQLLREASKEDELLLASGYFNLTDQYLEVILQESLARYRLLTASPEVNGFFGARGVAGYIPAAYIYIARHFFERTQHLQQSERIHLYEYFRDRWTFHVKGLWYYLPRETLPSLTLVGSPNFGYRSVYRDLECQVAIVTDNQGLREQLREEHVSLFQSSSLVTEERFQRADRQIPLWVTYATGLIKHFF